MVLQMIEEGRKWHGNVPRHDLYSSTWHNISIQQILSLSLSLRWPGTREVYNTGCGIFTRHFSQSPITNKAFKKLQIVHHGRLPNSSIYWQYNNAKLHPRTVICRKSRGYGQVPSRHSTMRSNKNDGCGIWWLVRRRKKRSKHPVLCRSYRRKHTLFILIQADIPWMLW